MQAQETGDYHAVLITGLRRGRKHRIVAKKDFIVIERTTNEPHQSIEYHQIDGKETKGQFKRFS
jgi:hypothetical protein